MYDAGGALASSYFSRKAERYSADSESHEAYMGEAVCSLSTHAVPDTACRKTLVGQETLKGIEAELKKAGRSVRYVVDRNVFRFGNSECLETDISVLIPAQFGRKLVVVRAAVLKSNGSRTPLLLSKEFLKQLGTRMDLSSEEVMFRKLGVCLSMGVTERGHYAISLFGKSKKQQPKPVESHVHRTIDASANTLHVDREVLQQDSSICQVDPINIPEDAALSAEPGVDGAMAAAAVNGRCTDGSNSGEDSRGEGGERFGSRIDVGQPSRSARRRKRRQAARLKALGEREIQGQDLPLDILGTQGICQMDERECGAREKEVLVQFAGVPSVYGAEKSEEEDPHPEGARDHAYQTADACGISDARCEALSGGKRLDGDYVSFGAREDVVGRDGPDRAGDHRCEPAKERSDEDAPQCEK